MKKFILTDHGKLRLQQRGIAMSDIKMVVTSPKTKLTQQGGSIKVNGSVRERDLVVIYESKGKIIVIITSYYAS